MESEKTDTAIMPYAEMITLENLLRSFQKFRSNKKHKADVMEFTARLISHLAALHHDLQRKTYTHGRYEHFTVNDPKKRDIHKSSVRDRVVHRMLYDALYPYFDTKFIHDSYSCRIGKGTHRAIQRFAVFTRQVSRVSTKPCYILKCDIRKFFASIDHAILKSILVKHIVDRDILQLLFKIIDSFHSSHPLRRGGVPSQTERRAIGSEDPQARRGARDESGTHGDSPPLSPLDKLEASSPLQGSKNTKGLPLGNLTSQILVNIYMNEFDQFMKHIVREKYYIRYADDFVVISQDKNYLEKLIPTIDHYLQHTLRLNLHPDKVFIKTIYSGIDFLGWTHFPSHRVLRTVTKRRMMNTLRRNGFEEASKNSYLGMLSHGNSFKIAEQIKRQNF